MPTQRIVVLGFVLNSLTMTVMLTKEKAVNLKRSCALLYTRLKGNHSTSGTAYWGNSGQLSWGYAWPLYTIGIWKVTNPKPLKPTEVILMHTCPCQRRRQRIEMVDS